MDITATFADSHAQEWSGCRTLQFGPPGPGTPWRYLLVSRDGQPWLRICLDLQAEEFHAFEECLVCEGALWTGFAERVVRLGLQQLDVREIPVDFYFGSFFALESSLLVCSGTRIVHVDALGNELWTSPQLGIDGVLVSQVADGVIEGQGEWDPPGGWRDFRLDLNRGELLA